MAKSVETNVRRAIRTFANISRRSSDDLKSNAFDSVRLAHRSKGSTTERERETKRRNFVHSTGRGGLSSSSRDVSFVYRVHRSISQPDERFGQTEISIIRHRLAFRSGENRSKNDPKKRGEERRSTRQFRKSIRRGWRILLT